MIWAFESPLRIRILELVARQPTIRQSASDLREALSAEFEDLETRQVVYQLAQLHDAELLPRSSARG